jgi:hypothetical protein
MLTGRLVTLILSVNNEEWSDTKDRIQSAVIATALPMPTMAG